MAKQLHQLDANTPQIMAILNITPDSFSDGGRLYKNTQPDLARIRKQAQQALADGATILDIGGESTRPGAVAVSLEQELERVIPVFSCLQGLDAVLSLDSSRPEVFIEAAKYGLGLINDVRALQAPGALEAAATLQLPVCLMHMQGSPETMQQAPSYLQLEQEVQDFFVQRIAACKAAGIKESNILLDPGFGFGKNVQHNATLLHNLASMQRFDRPLLVGMSRKSMVSDLLNGRTVEQRLFGSLALAVMAVERGAWIVRVHDVKASYDAVMAAHKITIIGEDYGKNG